MRQTGMKYGLICGLVYIVFNLINTLLGTQTSGNMMMSFLVNIVMFAATFYVIYLGVKEFRDAVNAGTLTIGDGVKLGLMIGLIAGLIAAVFGYIYQTFIDPEMMERILDETRRNLEERGMTDEQVDQALWGAKMMQNPALTAGLSILWITFWGLIKGLIAGAILKRQPEPTVE